jgi:hypothetical protein
MRSHFGVVKAELGLLRTQLEVAQAVLDLAHLPILSTDPPDVAERLKVLQGLVHQTETSYRIHQYRSTIVSLYGSLERFVESLVEEAARRLGQLCLNYGDLPTGFRQAHLSLTMDILRHIEEPRYAGITTVRELVGRLNSCLDGDPGFTLNSMAFGRHTSNFRHSTVQDVLGRIGVSTKSLEGSQRFGNLMAERFPNAKRYHVVDDLAERRNEVAHGQSGSILSFKLLVDYIDIIEAYAEGLMTCVIGAIASSAIPTLGMPLGVPDQIFRNTIAGFIAAPLTLILGDFLGFVRGDGRCAVARIESLEVNGETRVRVDQGEPVGVRTGVPCSGAIKMFRLPQSMADLDSSGLELFL